MKDLDSALEAYFALNKKSYQEIDDLVVRYNYGRSSMTPDEYDQTRIQNRQAHMTRLSEWFLALDEDIQTQFIAFQVSTCRHRHGHMKHLKQHFTPSQRSFLTIVT